MKTALITGVTGQDGCYLAKLLIEKGYRIIGALRRGSRNFDGIKYLNLVQQIELVEVDLLSADEVLILIQTYKPDEVYNLAAQSSVGESFERPNDTILFNVISVVNLLDAIKQLINRGEKFVKFYQASSSEMYGRTTKLPIADDCPIHPVSPYAVSKAAAHWTTVNYREAYGLYACCGVLFNHESYLRSESFFVKKVIREAIQIYQGERDVMYVGNLDVRRDFGYGPKYVEAMWLMLQNDQPKDYFICSGRSVLLSDIVKWVFEMLNIDLCKCKKDEKLYRPAEILDIYGDNTRAVSELSWDYNLDFKDVLRMLLFEELAGLGLESTFLR